MPRKEKESSQKEVTVLATMKHPNIVAFYSSVQGRLTLLTLSSVTVSLCCCRTERADILYGDVLTGC